MEHEGPNTPKGMAGTEVTSDMMPVRSVAVAETLKELKSEVWS